MDPSQTLRTADNPDLGRGFPVQGKQNTGLPTGFQPRPVGSQGQPPGSPRYPINNGSPQQGPRSVGGQLIAQQSQLLNQQSSTPSLNRLDSRVNLSSLTGTPNQFPQPRPPFGPLRPPNIPGVQPPGGYIRGPPPQVNLGLQGPRYPPPGTLGPAGTRGQPYVSVPGQRPIFNNNNPQQQIRPPRPELGGPQQQIRFGPQPYTLENRQSPPRIIPETVITSPQNNPVPTPRDSSNFERKPQIRPQYRERKEMEGTGLQSDSQAILRQVSIPRNGNSVDDDDDVVMDLEKDSRSSVNEKHTESPFSKRIDSPTVSPSSKQFATPESRASPALMKHEIGASPSPKDSKSPTPVPSDSTNDELRPKSRLSDNSKSPTQDMGLFIDKSRPSSSKSPVSATKLGSQTPDLLGSPPGLSSPKVIGFDNGIPRSLSPKLPSVTPSSLAPLSLKTPEPPSEEEPEKKKTTFADDRKSSENYDGKEVTTPIKSSSRPQTPKSFIKRSTSGRSMKKDSSNDRGSNQVPHSGTPSTNGTVLSPTKKFPPKLNDNEKPKTAGSPVKSPSKSVKSLPRTPEAGPQTTDKKKVPMNKVQVGAAPSPNLKTVRSKIGSLDNASYKPGGGKVKIENRKLDFSKAQPKIAAKNDKYAPSGGDKKITQVKLQWNAKPKVGSLDNATYRPGGGDKKIETVKLDFKDKAKPKVGSKDNAKHVPGGGTVKSATTPLETLQDSPSNIETQKIEIKAESKIGSLDNVKHKPGGGDKKIFNDRDYLRQTSSNAESVNGSGAQSPVPSSNSFIEGKNGLPTSDENLNQQC